MIFFYLEKSYCDSHSFPPDEESLLKLSPLLQKTRVASMPRVHFKAAFCLHTAKEVLPDLGQHPVRR